MSSIVVAGDTSGSITLQAPGVAGSAVLTLPAVSGTVLTTATGQTLTSPIITTINLTGGQITFPATQSASSDANTLDDYEEGTWTPQLYSDGAQASAYASQTGYYRKIGGQVTVWFNVYAATIPSGSYLRLYNLPFSVSTSGTGYQVLNSGSTGKTPIYLETYLGTGGQVFVNSVGYVSPSTMANTSIGGVYTYCAS